MYRGEINQKIEKWMEIHFLLKKNLTKLQDHVPSIKELLNYEQERQEEFLVEEIRRLVDNIKEL